MLLESLAIMLVQHRHLLASVVLTLGMVSSWTVQSQPPAAGLVVILSVQDAIGPATSDYVEKGIRHANEQNAALVILEMDTPGGLDTSIRDII